MIEARVERDTIWQGKRIITFVIRSPKFINAEINTHRALSRSFASSRSLTTDKIVSNIYDDPVMPEEWGQRTKYMYANEAVSSEVQDKAEVIWLDAMRYCTEKAKELAELGIHKQVVNRMIEPWMYQEGIITGTDWDNFFTLRTAFNAQPEIKRLALLMKDAMERSTPIESTEHVPFAVKLKEHIPGDTDTKFYQEFLIAAARCARVSYGMQTIDDKTNAQDLRLARRLLQDGHYSPFEHIAFYQEGRHANLNGWKSLRTAIGH